MRISAHHCRRQHHLPRQGQTSLKKALATASAFFLAGAEGFEVALQPLLRCPNTGSLGARRVVRPRRFVTLAVSSTGRARDLTRHAARASGSRFYRISKNSPSATAAGLFLGLSLAYAKQKK